MADVGEAAQLDRIGEDNPRQRSPIDPAVGVDDGWTELRHDGVVGSAARFEDRPAEGVHVDHDGAAVAQQLRNGGLAGADSAGESDDDHDRYVSAAAAMAASAVACSSPLNG